MAPRWTLTRVAAVATIVGVLLALFGLWKSQLPRTDASNTASNITASPGGKKARDPNLYLECHTSALPTKPVGDRIYGLTISEGTAHGGGGLAEYFAPNQGGQLTWPTPSNGIPATAQHCELRNDAAEAVLSIELTLLVQLRNVITNKRQPDAQQAGPVVSSIPWIVDVARIDPGPDRAFSFYIWNYSNQFADVIVPDEVTVKILGENDRRKINVNHPQILMSFSPFTPAKGN